jgi:hypothetical protein
MDNTSIELKMVIQKLLLLLILCEGEGRELLHTLWCACAGPGGEFADPGKNAI